MTEADFIGITQQLQRLGRGVEAVAHPDFPPPLLPVGLRAIEINDWSDNSRFRLVVADPPSRFDELVLPNPNVSPLAILLKNALAGGGTLLDIGAHIGTVALPVALAGSRVIAIEMNPANCLRLIHGAIENRLGNLAVVQVAASDVDVGARLRRGDRLAGDVRATRYGRILVRACDG